MKYKVTSYTGIPEFLASDDYQAIPAHITETGPVLAGTPIGADGKKTTNGATGAVGILLYDVNPADNPNCALLVDAIVNLTKMNAHSGLSLTAAAVQAALPKITCRENIGVNS